MIFVPVSFMSSVSGRFLYQFGITAAVAVMVSLFVSFTLTPMMCARLLRPRKKGASDASSESPGEAHGAPRARSRAGLYGLVERSYLAVLRGAMRFRVVPVLLSLAVIGSVPWLYDQVRVEYIPTDVDEAEFEVRVTGPQSASVAAMDEAMREVEAEIRSTPNVELVLASTGGGFLGMANSGDVYVRITPHDQRLFSIPRFLKALVAGNPGSAFEGNISQREVMAEVRKRLRRFKDLRCSVRNVPSFNIGGGSFEIDFGLLGPDLVALADYTERLRDRAEELGGIVDVDTTLKLDKPERRVLIDRERAADLGVDVQDIAGALRLLVGGDTRVSRYRDEELNEEYDVQLRLQESDRASAADVERLYVPGRDGPVRVDNLVTIEAGETAARIDRLDRQRVNRLRAAVGPGYALADRLAALRTAAAEMNLPPTYSTIVTGRGRELDRTFVEFLWAFLLSIIFMYIILAAQFESVVDPLTILLSLPLALPFGILALVATGNTLNLYSALGLLVLFGVVKKNSILQIDHTNKLRESGMERGRAILEANRDRLRPILMTTLTLVVGMIPLAVGTGPGAEERRSIAVVVIGGQAMSLFLTLIVTPVAYSLFDDFAGLFRRRSVSASDRTAVAASLPGRVE